MDFNQYQQLFQTILNAPAPAAPYDSPDYLNYAKLNWSRQQRWLKTGVLNPELATAIKNISQQQYWKIITEPWCGDAAHTLPFIHLLSELNPLITADFQQRDSAPFLIDHYLTNGRSKSIPKLIIADKARHDLAVWGPRPLEAQQLCNKLTAEGVEFHEVKVKLQQWYNEDKGASFQQELLGIIGKTMAS